MALEQLLNDNGYLNEWMHDSFRAPSMRDSDENKIEQSEMDLVHNAEVYFSMFFADVNLKIGLDLQSLRKTMHFQTFFANYYMLNSAIFSNSSLL
jgi:hypothetical protein